MDTERWQRLSPLLDALLELSPEQRSEHLAALRREDAALADELAGLLALEADDEAFLSEPVVELPTGARPVPRLVRENDDLWLAVALPEANGAHLDFTWDIRSSPLPLFQRLRKITSGVILALGFFLLISTSTCSYCAPGVFSDHSD